MHIYMQVFLLYECFPQITGKSSSFMNVSLRLLENLAARYHWFICGWMKETWIKKVVNIFKEKMFKISLINKKWKIVQNLFLREGVVSYPSDLLECYFRRSEQYLVIHTCPIIPLARKGNWGKNLDLLEFV